MGSKSEPSGTKLSAHDWTEFQVVTGWAAVEQVLSRLALDQCGGAPLVCGSMSKSAAHVLYTYRCAFHSTHDCKWLARIRIPRDDAMMPVKPQQRFLVHAGHQCIVEVAADTSHCNHFAKQDTGAHIVWKAAVQKDPCMQHWNFRQIFTWLTDHHVEGVDKQLAHKCKRWNERERRKAAQGRVGRDVDLDTVGGLRSLACTYAFEAVSRDPTFCHDTAVLCPGWYINEHDVCLIFTTFNLLLNIHRANEYFGEKGLVYGVDHTFKVSRHVPLWHTRVHTTRCAHFCSSVCNTSYLCLNHASRACARADGQGLQSSPHSQRHRTRSICASRCVRCYNIYQC